MEHGEINTIACHKRFEIEKNLLVIKKEKYNYFISFNKEMYR